MNKFVFCNTNIVFHSFHFYSYLELRNLAGKKRKDPLDCIKNTLRGVVQSQSSILFLLVTFPCRNQCRLYEHGHIKNSGKCRQSCFVLFLSVWKGGSHLKHVLAFNLSAVAVYAAETDGAGRRGKDRVQSGRCNSAKSWHCCFLCPCAEGA